MKKIKGIITVLAACCVFTNMAMADGLVVSDISIPQGGTTTLNIAFNRTQNEYMGFEFKLALPAGITATSGTETLGERFNGKDHSLGMSLLTEGDDTGKYQFVSLSFTATAIPGNSGTLVCVEVAASAALAQGTYQATISGIEFPTTDGQPVQFEEVTFNISVSAPVESRVVLDETFTTVPETSNGAVDVHVKRAISAGNWNSIVLPFAMTASQLTTVFGADVLLADFKGVETIYNDNDDVVGLTANFSNATAIEANHPYIIKVSSPISYNEGFTVDGVTVTPDEDNAYIEFDNGKTGIRRVVYSGFYGTYHAETPVQEFCLFLNSNKFYYSDGTVTMKGYRAFFEFRDVLTAYDQASSNVKMVVNIDGEETSIEGIDKEQITKDSVYDLGGRKVTKPQQRGVYIVNGKKFIVK